MKILDEALKKHLAHRFAALNENNGLIKKKRFKVILLFLREDASL